MHKNIISSEVHQVTRSGSALILSASKVSTKKAWDIFM